MIWWVVFGALVLLVVGDVVAEIVHRRRMRRMRGYDVEAAIRRRRSSRR